MERLPCLDNFITFKAVCPGETYVRPLSGIHWEDLPGFGVKSMAAIEPGKYLNAVTFGREKLHVAGSMILDKMRAAIEPYVQERGVKEAGYIGTYTDESPLTPSLTGRGIRVRVDGGPMLLPTIPRIWLKSSTAVSNLVVKVKDGNTITEFPLDSLPADQETEVWLHYEAANKQVDIFVENASFAPYTGDTQGTKYFTNCTGCAGHARYVGIAGGGLVGSTETTILQGMRAEVVLLCSIDPIACILLKRYKWAVAFQAGILVLQEWGPSDRANYFTLHGREWAKETADGWNLVELPRAMKTNNETLVAFLRNMDPTCLTCGSGPSYVEGHA